MDGYTQHERSITKVREQCDYMDVCKDKKNTDSQMDYKSNSMSFKSEVNITVQTDLKRNGSCLHFIALKSLHIHTVM